MNSDATTWRIGVVVPDDAVDAFELALEPFCVAVSRFVAVEGKTWRVEGDCTDLPDPETLSDALARTARLKGIPVPDLSCFPVAARDWVFETQRAFPPLSVARYFIHGTHFSDDVPVGRITIALDAGRAFGSGEHASTAGCLTAMDEIAGRRRPRRILDVGCGSGILSIAAAKTWHRRVVAVDNDPIAVRVTRDNARLNGVTAYVRAGCGNGYAAPVVRTHERYDLILANILARPLCRMARDLRGHLAPGGHAVLAGFIDRDWRRVLSAHEAVGLRLSGRIVRDGWTTLVVRL